MTSNSLTPFQLAALQILRRYKLANRRIIQGEVCPKDRDGSTTRDLLRGLTLRGLIKRVGGKTNEYVTSTAPLYVPTQAGCAMLATETGNMKLLLDRPPNIKDPQLYDHYLRVTRLLLDFEKALQKAQGLDVVDLFTEHCVVNPLETDPRKRHGLLTPVGKGARGGTVVWAPDAAIIVSTGKTYRLYGFELETGSSDPNRVAARKHLGVHYLLQTGLYREICQQLTSFRVICVCPTPAWRDCFHRAMEDRPGREHWLLVAREDIDPSGRFLSEPVFHTVSCDAPRPFRTPPTAPRGELTGGGEGGAAPMDVNI